MRGAWLLVAIAAGCGGPDAGRNDDTSAAAVPDADSTHAGTSGTMSRGGAADDGPRTELPPNELGRIAVLEYHLIGEPEARWTRSPENFRTDLELLYSRGYRPVSLKDIAAKRIDLPAGTSPVVFTFDDASPGQFRYIERDGELHIDPASAVGIWLDFAKSHPGWANKAVFCMLSGAEAGRSFFGNKDIEGQKTEWRHPKVQFLAAEGFELCNHTLWHATLSRYDDAFAQEQIARLQLAVDSAVPGYAITSFALPLGEWPKNRDSAARGSWTDPKSGKTTSYQHDILLLVAGGPARSPHDPEFDGLRVPRVQVYANELQRMLDELDRNRSRYVSDGNTGVIAQPRR
ncbi:MAG TPA: polysaccharide deacetylase family protein [Longimicrobiales bacterium]|nr:polysaccharide deacetylase family protein [Longimicrobiales bacterium]